MSKLDVVDSIQKSIVAEVREMYPNMSNNQIREYITSALVEEVIKKFIVCYICSQEKVKRE